MKVFLGSSTESTDRMLEVASWLQDVNFEVIPWDEPGLFQPGENTLDALIRISRSVDAAVFIFAEDDTVWFRTNTLVQPRDNVLIEYGLFVGALGPKRAIVAKHGNPKTAADLHGVTVIDISPNKKIRGKLELRKWAQGFESSDQATTSAVEILRDRALSKKRLNLANQQLQLLNDQSTAMAGQVGLVEIPCHFRALVKARGIRDFGRPDLATDGHWRLLFDQAYFQSIATLLRNHFQVPSDIYVMLSKSGLQKTAWSLSFQRSNRSYVQFSVAKLLRRFREYERPERFQQFLTALPQAVRQAVDQLGRQRVMATTTQAAGTAAG